MSGIEPSNVNKKRLRPKMYSIAVYIVVFFVVAEVVMLGGIFWFRQTKIEMETHALPVEKKVPTLNTSAPDTSVPNLPKPEVPGRLNVVPQNEKIVNEVARLNDDAQKFWKNGDFSLAESALNQALELDPNHAQTLVNLAMLQESLGDNENALASWKKVLAVGNSDEKVTQMARERANNLQQELLQTEEAKERELARMTLKRQMVIDSVQTAPEVLDANTTYIARDVIIRKADATLNVDPSKMKIQFLFCNQLADGRIVTPKIVTNFINPSPNWANSDTETLHAQYAAADNRDLGSSVPIGYLLRIYYNNELQDERAEPAFLLKWFPSTPQAENTSKK